MTLGGEDVTPDVDLFRYGATERDRSRGRRIDSRVAAQSTASIASSTPGSSHPADAEWASIVRRVVACGAVIQVGFAGGEPLCQIRSRHFSDSIVFGNNEGATL
ncbi:hypothetical protein GCM10029978_116560 [Actinoallomurus acanthiterrae]